jgi:rod shape-determining protein MreD
MIRGILRNITFYTTVLVFQLLIFNHFKIFDFITPFLYLIIFILYKTSYNKTILIILGFIIGIIVDLSMQTYGCNTFATITICYLREWIEKYSFGVNSNLPLAMIKGTPLINRLTFFGLIILIHSLIYNSLIFFNIEVLGTIIFSTLTNSIVTFIVIWLISQLISNK